MRWVGSGPLTPPHLNLRRRRGLQNSTESSGSVQSPAAFRPPPRGSARPPPGLPPSPARPLRRGWWPSRIAVPRPRRRRRLKIVVGEDRTQALVGSPGQTGSSGMAVVAGCGQAAHFYQPQPQFLKFRGEKDCRRGRGGVPGGRNADVYLRVSPKPRFVEETGGLSVVSANW